MALNLFHYKMVMLQPCASNTKLVALGRPGANARLVNRKGTPQLVNVLLDAVSTANWFLLQNKGCPLEETTRGQSTTRQIKEQ